MPEKEASTIRPPVVGHPCNTGPNIQKTLKTNRVLPGDRLLAGVFRGPCTDPRVTVGAAAVDSLGIRINLVTFGEIGHGKRER